MEDKIPVQKKVMLISIIMVFAFVLSNLLMLWRGNWYSFNSEVDTGLFSQHLVETGSIKIPAFSVDGVDDSVFVPSGVRLVDGFYVPKIAVGTIFVSAAGQVIGDVWSYFVFSSVTLLGGLLLFKLVDGQFGFRAGLFALLLYVVSYPVLWWNNFLYANGVGFTLFLGGVYLLQRFFLSGADRRYLYLGYALMLAAMWIRYEYAIYIGLTALVVFFTKRTVFHLKDLFMLGVLSAVLFLIPFMALNTHLYGNPLTVGYVVQSTIVENAGGGDSGTLVGSLQSLLQRFPLARNPAKSLGIVGGARWILRNVWLWYVRFIPVTVLAGVGYLLTLGKADRKNIPVWVMILAVCSAFALYFEGSAYHWGWAGGTDFSFYTRYWFIVFAFTSAVAGVWAATRSKAVQVFVVAAAVLFSMYYYWGGAPGIFRMQDSREQMYSLYQWSKELEPEAVVVTDVVSKAIIDRPVFHPLSLEGFGEYDAMFQNLEAPRADSYELLGEKLADIVSEGYIVYLVEYPSHRQTFFNIGENLTVYDDHLAIQRVISPSDAFDVYRVDMK